jgi:hypothetical protein
LRGFNQKLDELKSKAESMEADAKLQYEKSIGVLLKSKKR